MNVDLKVSPQRQKFKEMEESLIKKLRVYFSGQPVLKAWLFGSRSRGDYRDDSVPKLKIITRTEIENGVLKLIFMFQNREKCFKRGKKCSYFGVESV